MYKPVAIPPAAALAAKKLSIDTFLGADLTTNPSNVDMTQSPDCPNMIRDVPGKVRKRMGWSVQQTYDGRINGCYRMGGAVLIHAGTSLYKAGAQIYTGMF